MLRECSVWWAPVTATVRLDALDDTERRRAANYLREVDRARSAVGAALLRLAVAECTGAPPGQVVVHRTCPRCGAPHGRPTLPDTSLHASVSHSGEWVTVALTGAGEVGVDVEKVAGADTGELSPQVLAAGEEARTPREFYIYWTRKEAILKATGDGLTVPMNRLHVGPADRPPALGRYPGRPDLVACLRDLAAPDRHVGAVAVLTSELVTVTERGYSDLAGG